ncbi:HK97 gp10 family phage protein [Gordonia sp. WA4-43]|uniref:HK97 gp10 family phage protein n=1 Tax=Gordonia sp. WA4-43 TaxID=2878678 RepID=UPI001CFC1BF7|nr:HK97 gp10 family phage protein [Gordonia sp. WA4-43]UCZ92578.1 HK97 gp10 family phage protein [Gordonia sp. WA4-43]
MALAASEGVRRGAELILDEAKSRTPVDTGMLRDSGEVTEMGGSSVRVRFRAPHAHLQHDKDYEHPRGGEKEFLKNAEEATRSQVEQLVASEMRTRFGRR